MPNKMPSIGRRVHFVSAQSGNSVHLAATVVYVWSWRLVNLNVLPNGLEVVGAPMTMTSIEYDPDGAPGTWHWPEYVPDGVGGGDISDAELMDGIE